LQLKQTCFFKVPLPQPMQMSRIFFHYSLQHCHRWKWVLYIPSALSTTMYYMTKHIFEEPTNCRPKQFSYETSITKEIVERRHGEPINFLFLPKMGLLGSQAGNEKKCWLWIMSNFLELSWAKIQFFKKKLHCRVRTKKLLHTKLKKFQKKNCEVKNWFF
jgi:hypothetical protein